MYVVNTDKELRTEERLHVVLPSTIAKSACLTRDISASGVYLESNAAFEIDQRIDFEIQLESPAGKLLLKCNGDVVRVEKRNGKVGVAVKIAGSVISSV